MSGANAAADFAHARDAVEARVGALLLLAGFIGQTVGDTRSSWSATAALIAYLAAAALILGSLLALRPSRRHHERQIFLAQLLLSNSAKARCRLYLEYLSGFAQRHRSKRELDEWLVEAARRLGHHPWRAELTVTEQQSVDREQSG